ncbi:hypothetical protein Poly59_18540 [Rubripirellula reticaptiva]|uniref:Tetratricopeptide repeat protein n=2 Tax=Rubripirellula reticaptiva TaxID=2528013 RepID=A0A5C6F4X3_9BACT|nr:hypothetical protein Poly59_18540 [Rubripirellula reticaptiva]
MRGDPWCDAFGMSIINGSHELSPLRRRLVGCVLAVALVAGTACSAKAQQAQAQAQAQQAQAQQWLARAAESSAQIESPSAISNAATSLARVHARLGQVDAAFEAAKRISKPQLKLYALRGTVQAAVDNDLSTAAIVDEAKRTLDGNDNPFTQSTMKTLLHVAESKTKTVPREQANATPPPTLESLRKAFDEAADRDAKLAAFQPLAVQLLQSKSFDSLENLIENAVEAVEQEPRPDVSSKFGTYGDLATIAKIRSRQLQAAFMLADDGEVAAAIRYLKIVDPLIDALPDQAALVKWELQSLRIRLLLKLNRTDVAITQLDKVQSPLIRSSAAAAIAAHEIEAGDFEAGLEMAKRIGDEPGSGDANGEVAISLFVHGDRKVAAEFVNQLGTSDQAMNTFVSLARFWVETGNFEQLESVFDDLESPEARTHYAVAAAEYLKLDRPRH